MCSQLIQNVNISFEICTNVSGSPMDLCKDLTWIPGGGTAGRPWIIIWISYGFSMDPPKDLYGSSYDVIWIIIWIHISKIIEFQYENVRLYKNNKNSLENLIIWSLEAKHVWNMCNFVRDVNPSNMFKFHWKYV